MTELYNYFKKVLDNKKFTHYYEYNGMKHNIKRGYA
jgi:hypothetical protein